MSSYPLRQSARTLRGLVRRVHNSAFGPAPRAAKDYATHLPILVGLAHSFEIVKVLELGCGDFSSLTFLNRDVFQCLDHLTSFETDQVWLQRVSEKLREDMRFSPRFIPGSMAEGIEQVDLEDFDIVFVDDSTNAEERKRTIQTIYQKKPQRPFIVIHDFEVGEYRFAAKDFRSRYIFKALTPQTGVVWNGTAPSTALKKIDRTIKQFCAQLEPDDLNNWKLAFAKG